MSLELFKKGFINGELDARNQFCKFYQPQVIRWVRRTPGYYVSDETVEYFAGAGWERFLTSIQRQPLKFHKNNESIGPILQYLKRCINSAIIDYNRQNDHQFGSVDIKEVDEWYLADIKNPETNVQKHNSAENFWDMVIHLCQGQKESLVISNLFIAGFKPREIYHQHRDVFSSINEIYKTKENFMKRLRRNERIQFQLSALV